MRTRFAVCRTRPRRESPRELRPSQARSREIKSALAASAVAILCQVVTLARFGAFDGQRNHQNLGETTMAKGEQRSNREAKKPKKEKIKTIAAAPSQKGVGSLQSGVGAIKRK
jgi:hypothetical protein